MQRPSQSSTHNYPLNCLPMACTLNRSLLPITTSTISKGYCTFSGSDVDVDGFRVRAQGWTRWMKPKRTIAKLNCNGTLIFLNNTHTHTHREENIVTVWLILWADLIYAANKHATIHSNTICDTIYIVSLYMCYMCIISVQFIRNQLCIPYKLYIHTYMYKHKLSNFIQTWTCTYTFVQVCARLCTCHNTPFE